MTSPAAFPYVLPPGAGPTGTPKPLLPVTIERDGIQLAVDCLVDSGASLSVLPFSVGSRFGLDWNSLTQGVGVGGVVKTPAKFMATILTIGPLPPVMQLFAWASSDDVPLVLGYVNFFLEFDVCFYATRGIFTVEPHAP